MSYLYGKAYRSKAMPYLYGKAMSYLYGKAMVREPSRVSKFPSISK